MEINGQNIWLDNVLGDHQLDVVSFWETNIVQRYHLGPRCAFRLAATDIDNAASEHVFALLVGYSLLTIVHMPSATGNWWRMLVMEWSVGIGSCGCNHRWPLGHHVWREVGV